MSTPRKTPAAPTMILPSLTSPDRPLYLNDERMPAKFNYDDTVRAVGASLYRNGQPAACTRHLFDALETAKAIYDDEDNETVDFRLVLTCVKCGHIEKMTGNRTQESYRYIDPTPLTYKGFQAQQVNTDSGWKRDYSTWSVHEAGAPEPIGAIQWAIGPRGRAYFVGKLAHWQDGRHIEAKTPAAALKALHNEYDQEPK